MPTFESSMLSEIVERVAIALWAEQEELRDQPDNAANHWAYGVGMGAEPEEERAYQRRLAGAALDATPLPALLHALKASRAPTEILATEEARGAKRDRSLGLTGRPAGCGKRSP